MTFTYFLDTKIIERINKLIFEETTDPDKTIELLREMLVIRGVLCGQEKKEKIKSKSSYLSRLESFTRNSLERVSSLFAYRNQGNNSTSQCYNAKNSSAIKNYIEEEKRKTWYSLERIYKKGIIDSDEAKRIFKKIYGNQNL